MERRRPTLVAVIATGLLCTVGMAACSNSTRDAATSTSRPDNSAAGTLATFDTGAVQELTRQVLAERAGADRAYASWAAHHPGAHRDDFIRFALDQLPPPPAADRQRAELDELARLASQRTPDLIATAAELSRALPSKTN